MPRTMITYDAQVSCTCKAMGFFKTCCSVNIRYPQINVSGSLTFLSAHISTASGGSRIIRWGANVRHGYFLAKMYVKTK